MNTEIIGTNGRDPVQIFLTLIPFSAAEIREFGPRPRTALLTVRSKDTDLDAKALTKLGNACLRAAKFLRKKGA